MSPSLRVDVLLSRRLRGSTLDEALLGEYNVMIVRNNELDHLSLCLIQPKFNYVPHAEKANNRVLRAPQTFLSPKIIQKVEEIRSLGQWGELPGYDAGYQSPKKDHPAKSIVVLYTTLQDLVSEEGEGV